MLDEDDDGTAMSLLEQGAFLCVKRPISIELVRCLWQHVAWDKLHRFKEKDKFKEDLEYISKNIVSEHGQNYYSDNGERHKAKQKPNLETPSHDNVMFKRKVWTEWTQELHDKFMDAVIQLGEGSTSLLFYLVFYVSK